MLGGVGPVPPPTPVATCPDSTEDWPDDPSTILGLQEGDGVVADGGLTPDEAAQRPRVHRLQELLNQNLPAPGLQPNCSFDDQTEAKLVAFQSTMTDPATETETADIDDRIGAPVPGKPGSASGKVDLPTANALLAKKPPPPTPACPPRDPGEKTASFFANPTVTFSPASQELLIQGFAIGSKVLTGDVQHVAAWEKAISVMAGDPNMKVALAGFTDCAGNDTENTALQQQRVTAVKAAMPAVVQSRVIPSLSPGPKVFLAGNATAAERALNRAVQIKFNSIAPTGQGPFDRLVNGATTLDEYLFLVRSLEQRLGLTTPADTPKALSVIRQIYYGSASWTKAGGRAGLWNRIITVRPWSPGDDPTPQLTPPLMAALQNSQVVEGIDVGHVFTGLDAMMNPQAIAPTSLLNEEVASWEGDVGSAAAEWAVDTSYGRRVPKSDKRPVGTPDEYFKGFASEADLVGDIDAFAIRAGFSPGSAPSSLLMSKVQLRGPLSEALMLFYRISSSDLAKARNRRFVFFLESYGGVVNGTTLTNAPVVTAAFQPKVLEFAAGFAFLNPLPKHQQEYGDRTVPPGDPRPLNDLLIDGGSKMTDLFVNFLVKKL